MNNGISTFIYFINNFNRVVFNNHETLKLKLNNYKSISSRFLAVFLQIIINILIALES